GVAGTLRGPAALAQPSGQLRTGRLRQSRGTRARQEWAREPALRLRRGYLVRHGCIDPGRPVAAPQQPDAVAVRQLHHLHPGRRGADAMTTRQLSTVLDRRTFIGRLAAGLAATVLLGRPKPAEATTTGTGPFIGEIMLF